MKKTFHDKLEVKLDEKGRPLAFSFREGTARRAPTCANGRHPANYKVVNILRWWREPGRWWEGEPVTLYLRLQVSRGDSTGRAVPVVKEGDGPMFCEEGRPAGSPLRKLRGNPPVIRRGLLRPPLASLLRRPAVVGVASLRRADSQRQMSAPVMPVIFEIYRTGEKWYFHRLLG